MSKLVNMAKIAEVWHWFCVIPSLLVAVTLVGVSWEGTQVFFVWAFLVYIPKFSEWLGDQLQTHPRLFGFSWMWFDFMTAVALISSAGLSLKDGYFNFFYAFGGGLTLLLQFGPIIVAFLVNVLTRRFVTKRG